MLRATVKCVNNLRHFGVKRDVLLPKIDVKSVVLLPKISVKGDVPLPKIDAESDAPLPEIDIHPLRMTCYCRRSIYPCQRPMFEKGGDQVHRALGASLAPDRFLRLIRIENTVNPECK
jgi:hypothetical protein